MKYYIVCTVNGAPGGHELAHQCCYEINKCGYDAKMYYVKAGNFNPVDAETNPKFVKYEIEHVKTLEEVDQEGNVVIVPEGLTDWTFAFHHATVVIWWMSVDNFLHISDVEYITAMNVVAKYHLVQSKYAEEFVKSQHVDDEKIVWLSDYIGDIYGQFILPGEYRKRRVVFNPKKGFQNLEPLIERCPDIEWVPLINMTEEEMVLNMQLARVYIDFGNHPGKDRIPREAVVCGCCIMTNMDGSAAYYEDVPIDSKYKFAAPIDYDNAEIVLRELIDNFSTHFSEFDSYRSMVKSEKEYFNKCIRELTERI